MFPFKGLMKTKKTSIFYDNFSGNTGDNAIGLSLIKILSENKINFQEYNGNFFNRKENIIVGGGLLLRDNPDKVYSKFRIKGKHILNCMGILYNPPDLQYLNDYKYLTVRSEGDKKKLSYLSQEVKVVPCTTMILEDLPGFNFSLKKPAIGVHLLSYLVSREADKKKFINWANNAIKQGFTIYFIPITLYLNYDQHMLQLSSEIPGSVMLPVMEPLEVFTLIGKFDYLICCSLHAAIFSYIHNVPFLLYNSEEKMGFFLEDRNLGNYLFNTFNEMTAKFDILLNYSIDFTRQIIRDKKKIQDHIYTLTQILK
jgi:hypothetical protein